MPGSSLAFRLRGPAPAPAPAQPAILLPYTTITGWLVADGFARWVDLPATWSAWTNWNASPKSPIAYYRLIDVGFKTKFIPLVTVVVDGTPVIEEQHSDDGVNFSAFATAGVQIDARYVFLRVTVTGAYPKIKSMRTFAQLLKTASYSPVGVASQLQQVPTKKTINPTPARFFSQTSRAFQTLLSLRSQSQTNQKVQSN